jgi:hypothetical protein
MTSRYIGADHSWNENVHPCRLSWMPMRVSAPNPGKRRVRQKLGLLSWNSFERCKSPFGEHDGQRGHPAIELWPSHSRLAPG